MAKPKKTAKKKTVQNKVTKKKVVPKKKAVKKKAHSAWQDHERDFAKHFRELLNIDVRRNDTKFNAGDKERNSDVNVEHPRLAFSVPIINDQVMEYKGIVAELKYSRNGFNAIYTPLNELCKKSGTKHNVLIINGLFMCFYIESFMGVWDWFVKNKTVAGTAIRHFSVLHKTVKLDFKFIKDAQDQAGRYAKTFGLYPVVCIRRLRGKQIVIVSTNALAKKG